MAKFEVASDDVIELFNSVRNNTTIPEWVRFEVFCNSKQKELYKIVKLNELVEILTEGINFAVIFNEEIFEQLTDEQKEMVMNECIAGVCISDTDMISLEKPNFSTYRGILQKYGHEPIIVLHESIKSLYDSKKQKEDELKAQSKGKRGRKSKI